VPAGVVLGFLVWTMGYASEAVAGLLGMLAALRRPVALLDESGELRLPQALVRRCRARIFRLADDVAAGSQVGRYLVDLGHRAVAFVSPVHGAYWSRRRLAGLAQAVAAADGRVATLTLDKRDQSAFVTGLTRPLADEALRRIGSTVAGGHLALTYTAHTTHERLDAALEHQAMGAHLDRVLARTVRQSDATAWVAASDSVALLCLDFLKRHRRAVPGDVSVVGFDDGLDAFINRLTSYNFNGSAAVHAMLRHVLDDRRARGPETALTLGFDGFIAERSTVARVSRPVSR
jgi:DNA-binding LacI/PurR family transcriptional regulator